MSAAEDVAPFLAQLTGLNLDGLRAEWRRRFREPVPTCQSSEFLRFEIAWRVQAKIEGGLDRISGRRLRAEARLLLETPRRRGTRPPALPVGAKLLRDWRGRQHRVEVLTSGYAYDGKTYASLSLIAREITGARWSGPRFFGVKA